MILYVYTLHVLINVHVDKLRSVVRQSMAHAPPGQPEGPDTTPIRAGRRRRRPPLAASSSSSDDDAYDGDDASRSLRRSMYSAESRTTRRFTNASSSDDDDDDARREDTLRARVRGDLRRNVRDLASTSSRGPLSGEWFVACNALSRVAEYCVLEMRSAPSSKHAPDATLWERDDAIAPRFVLEEGKLNVVIRALSELCVFTGVGGGEESSSSTREDVGGRAGSGLSLDDAVTSAAYNHRVDETVVRENLREFERAGGVVLERCLTFVECVQTCDFDEVSELRRDRLPHDPVRGLSAVPRGLSLSSSTPRERRRVERRLSRRERVSSLHQTRLHSLSRVDLIWRRFISIYLPPTDDEPPHHHHPCKVDGALRARPRGGIGGEFRSARATERERRRDRRKGRRCGAPVPG